MSSVVVFLSFPIFVASALQEVTVRSMEDAVLHCQGPRGENITLLEWSRAELQSDGYVFFYRNNRPYENYQHDFFKGRVELRDPSMREGDVSVIVRNVSASDTGTYECLITTSSVRGGKRVVSEFNHNISLTVTGFRDENTKERGEEDGGEEDGGEEDKPLEATIIVPVLSLMLLVFIVTVAVKFYRRKTSNPKSDHRKVNVFISK